MSAQIPFAIEEGYLYLWSFIFALCQQAIVWITFLYVTQIMFGTKQLTRLTA
jgi:hypothetical protein